MHWAKSMGSSSQLTVWTFLFVMHFVSCLFFTCWLEKVIPTQNAFSHKGLPQQKLSVTWCATPRYRHGSCFTCAARFACWRLFSFFTAKETKFAQPLGCIFVCASMLWAEIIGLLEVPFGRTILGLFLPWPSWLTLMMHSTQTAGAPPFGCQSRPSHLQGWGEALTLCKFTKTTLLKPCKLFSPSNWTPFGSLFFSFHFICCWLHTFVFNVAVQKLTVYTRTMQTCTFRERKNISFVPTECIALLGQGMPVCAWSLLADSCTSLRCLAYRRKKCLQLVSFFTPGSTLF